MAYVNVADWKPEQVAEWLKGLDNVVLQYIRLFVEKNINGQQLLDLQPNDLEEIGVYKIGHQEIILEAIDLLKNFYYDLDRENLQLLALRLSCLAHSLHNELWRNHINSSVVSTQVLADVANVVSAVKPLVCWLDRSPFCDQSSYVDTKTELLKLSLEMAMSGMRDRFVDKPIEYIRQSSKQLAELVDKIIQSIDDSLLLQPASLDLATLKKRPGDHLGFYIVPSFHGILQVGELKCNSAAHQSGKIETGDEIVQINYQTVVGWEVKEVMSLLFEETSTEILMTLKKRPRHSKVFGQIYIKPYRLPCRKQINYSTKWNDLLSPSRPELLTVPPHFGLQFKILNSKPIANTVETQVADRVSPPSPTPSTVSSSSSQSSESELMVGPSSPNSVRLYLPKPRIPVQRRATITGASPVSKQAPLSLEQFWHELKLEKEWRSNSDEKACEKANSETHLRRSPPAAHCSLTWSARLCEQMDSSVSDSSSSEKTPKPDKENADGNSFIPLKQRIDSLNKAIEQTSQNAKKPKLFPKPILSNAQNTVAKMESSSKPSSPLRSNMAKKNDRSPRRERGKLDKSYSTPSYDYSADSKEPLTFNMKLPEEKVKSAPDNITSESDSLSEFKKSLDMKPFTKPIKQDSLEIESEQNEYLEIRSDGVVEPELTESSASLPSEQELSSNKNKILDTIDSSLMIMDSESEANSLSEESPKLRPPLERSIPVQEIRPESNIFDREPKNELNDLPHDGIPKQIINSPISPTEKLVIHTTIDVPATFPRHKIDKKPISPPEPPPRPLKNAASHSKANQKAVSVTKSASRNISHKSPKVPRKKNPLLAKRRNVSVKELGTCDHEGTLYHRARKNNRESPHWIKGWFIIKGTIFYGFNSRDASHARLMISLPGFTVSPAEEVKSKNFAFKVYHTGTTFYFAAESGEDLAGWVDSFSKVTVSEEEQTIVMSETDGEEDESPTITTKKDKSGHEHGPHVAAKKIFSVISGHLSHTQDNKGDKKFNSLKKPSRKLAKEESSDGNHVSSLDRKYRKLFPVGSKQSIVAVPTAQFRSYRRIPPMEKPPAQLPEPSLSLDSNRPESLTCTAPMPSASPTRPPDMADYRLASLAKCNANNQRTPEASQPGGSMTLESFMLSRQEEERRQQQQHQQQQPHPPHATNILRVPQCHAPPPPTPIASHSAAVATGHEHPFLPPSRSRSEFSSHYNISFENPSSTDFRSKFLKKPAQYQPPPWETSNNNHNEESSRLQPAFEMTLDRNCPATNTVNVKQKKTEETSSSTLRFKSLFGSSKSDGQKTNLISSPRLRRVLFRDKKSHTTFPPNPATSQNPSSLLEHTASNNAPIATTSHSLEPSVSSTPEYPGLEYPPVFEPGTYSLSDVLRNRRMRTLERSELETLRQGEPFGEDASSTQVPFSNVLHTDNENNNFNFANRREDRNNDEFFRSNNFKRF